MIDPSKPLAQRKSIRLPDFDTSQPGGYFLTINAWEKRPLFGRLSNGTCLLSPIGEIVKCEWLKLPYRFPGIDLDAFSIMPTHFHGVFLRYEKEGPYIEQIETFGKPVSGSMATIVRAFKASVSVRVHQVISPKIEVWQRGYYEEFIDNDEKLNRIREYVLGNALKG